ncbi:Hypothetical_protein [Hexamita inflata]|uniref:Hypothetical_protein n=1 Tax=Hexamita inflata TaxID=28002 RepID=A0AA86UUF9_9EUKA|nr:Hypothetical protein HINF_LOCUS56054 [Hexamita inflata]CAI9968411.1 Hypothetical protein HINF_LOCUS56056 [Hexamita inflata]
MQYINYKNEKLLILYKVNNYISDNFSSKCNILNISYQIKIFVIRKFKFVHITSNLQTPIQASFGPFQLFSTHFKTYHQNKRVNVHIPPKLQLHVLEGLSSNDINIAISSSHTNSKSDSVEFTKWQSLTNQSGRCSELMDQINSSSYQLMIQLKRTEYLSNCSSKNEAVLKTLEKNKACMHRSLGK